MVIYTFFVTWRHWIPTFGIRAQRSPVLRLVSGVLYQKQVYRAWISILWDVITFPCPKYLFLAQNSSYKVQPSDKKIAQPSNFDRMGGVVAHEGLAPFFQLIWNNLSTVFFASAVLECALLIHLIDANFSYVWKHDDVINWKHFPRYWPFVRGIHRSPVNSPHKDQWRGALMFSLICA